MAGAVGDPVEGALLVFTADDRAVVEQFVAQDRYVREALVSAWQVRPWNVVLARPPDVAQMSRIVAPR